jgi:hypothetical protein
MHRPLLCHGAVAYRGDLLRAWMVTGPAVLLAAFALAACGGDVVVDDKDASGAGAAGSGPSGTGAVGPGTTGTGATGPGPSTVGTGPGSCTDHVACPPDSVCVFATGECAKLCQGDPCEACGPGTICDSCATSSCPECADCIGACMPVQNGRCDGDDPCADGALCYFPDSTCHVACPAFEPATCPPGEECASCPTGSCCGCDDCVDMCLPVFRGGAP